MQARSFITAVAAAVLALVLLTVGLLWGIDRSSPVSLARQPLNLPRAARFVPRDAALSLHWLADPTRLPAYAQAVAPAKQRRAARDGARQWRDGAFAMAGLDFDAELASWVGPELSLFVVDAGDAPGWVLALTSRDDDGARRFLQRFWQTRSLAGTDLQISSYRGMGLISGRGALLGREPQPLATALIDDDMLLLASGRGVLEQALDVSQLQDQHQLADASLQHRIADLGEGSAILTASPKALRQWFDLPEDLEGLDGLVAALQPQESNLAVTGLMRFRREEAPAAWPMKADLVSGAGGRADLMAQLQDPARLLDPAESHPLARWLGPLILRQIEDQPAARALLDLSHGSLLWQQQKEGWLLATQRQQPSVESLDERLEESGLARSELAGGGETLQVWTRLVRQKGRGAGLGAQLAVAQAPPTDRDWWGSNLAALSLRRDTRSLQPRLLQWQWLQRDGEPVQALTVGASPARDLLSAWRPWMLIQALAGQPLQSRVQGLSLGIDADRQDEDGIVLPLHARLELA